MATLPLAMCARMLGIHPKTLHHWLTQAKLPLAPHPTDARIKCVAEEHLLEVARRHRRPLPDLPSAPFLDGLSAPGSREEQTMPLPANEGEPDHPPALMSAPYASPADLIQKLSGLETKVVTLQEQLAQLALTLLQERERAVEHRIAALEALMQPLVGRQMLPDPQEQKAEQEPACALHRERQLLPAEQRARSRMPALIEYGAQGTYVIISAQEGELHLVPDSTEWFDWLASICSFRFVGQCGRFTAYRKSRPSGPSCGWTAQRCIHHRRYKHWLGVTDRLTIDHLEQMAAKLQSHLAAL